MTSLTAPAPDRWTLAKGGIESDLARLTQGQNHIDHLEMGGRAVNAIVHWAVSKEGVVTLDRRVRWPMIREKKDDTHAALTQRFFTTDDPALMVNGRAYAAAHAKQFRISGMLQWLERTPELEVRRTIFPSVSLPCLLERWQISNVSGSPLRLTFPVKPTEELLPAELFKSSAHIVRSEWAATGSVVLMPGQDLETGLIFSARAEGEPAFYPDIEAEWAGRQAYVSRLTNRSLVLTTGDKAVDQLFAFSKLRAAENVLATRGGLMHAPGGANRYLAALWCNDQNEYVSPFFPFLGDPAGNESARNAYRWFSTYMNPEFKPIPSSVVAEGRSFWNGAGDRGDAAMTAYGASRWALATGDPTLAREVWPFVEWCLEYCERQKTAKGVIASDSDELEGRFSSGKTNLATSCLTYDALVSASHLAEALGEPKSKAELYRRRAAELRSAIGRVFSANVAGFDTYRYHEGMNKLRAWICMPLVMDIQDRAKGTIDALFSPTLWTQDGLLTEAGSTTYWDRSTLYALRGVFRAGEPDRAADYLGRFARRRLLGDHVPYCQEAYPEQNQSHLSAESGLYCRIITEGVCGIRPTGFASFEATPRIPKKWGSVKLESIHAFGREWGFRASRRPKGIEVIVASPNGEITYQATLAEGQPHRITFAGR